MFTFMRTDPAGCRCTDCLTGYSIPVDIMTPAQVDYACYNGIEDASGLSERDWDSMP